MRVVYCGNHSSEWTTESDVAKAFEYLGHDVVRLQENATSPIELRQAAFEADLFLITTTWDDAQPLPEFIDTMRQCAMRGIPTATLHLDIFWGPSRGERKWWLSPMFFTRHVFTADGSNQANWEKLGIDHHWLRPGVRHDAAHFGEYRKDYDCDVALVGSNGIGYHEDIWGYRKELVDKLRQICKRRGWSWRNPGGDEPKIERGEDMNNFYASARVTIGDSLCLFGRDTLYCSDRVYEATGRGGFLIMPQLDFLAADFENRLPMYQWGDWVGLEKLIEHFLEHKDERQLRRLDCQQITAKNHTYVQRVEELLSWVI